MDWLLPLQELHSRSRPRDLGHSRLELSISDLCPALLEPSGAYGSRRFQTPVSLGSPVPHCLATHLSASDSLRPWRYTNLLTYLLTYMSTGDRKSAVADGWQLCVSNRSEMTTRRYADVVELRSPLAGGIVTKILITLRAMLSGAAYCYRSCLCLQRAGGQVVAVTTIIRNCVHRSSPKWFCRCR